MTIITLKAAREALEKSSDAAMRAKYLTRRIADDFDSLSLNRASGIGRQSLGSTFRAGAQSRARVCVTYDGRVRVLA